MNLKSIMTLGLAALCFASASHAQWVLVASSKSSINKLSADAAANVFLGKTADAGGASNVVVFDLPEGNALRDSFYKEVAKKEASAMKAYWSRMVFTGKGTPPKELGSAADVKKALAANPNAIGYLDKGSVDGSVKVLLE